MNCPDCNADLRQVGLEYTEATVPMNGKQFEVSGWECAECGSLVHLLT